MSSSIMLYKVDPVCAKTVKSKPTVKYSGFITYSNTIYFSGIWLDNSVYIITRYQNIVKKRLPHGSKKLGITKRVIKFGKLSSKEDILTVQ